MAAFKDEIGPALAGQLAAELERAWPEFPRRRFTRGISTALEPLELLARVDMLATRLCTCLPSAFSDAAKVLWTALESDTFTGWMTLPCGTYAARAGLDDPDVALPLLAGLTPRWSSEGPIRPFVEAHFDLTYRYLRRWMTDPDEHVRRLVSEGTRPRLPWAPQIRRLIADPSPNVELLDALADDPSAYVRRSVGNHLNDISKDHPDLAVDLARRWLGRGDGAAWAARRGLQTLVKRGHADALELLGAARDVPVEITDLRVDPTRIHIGGAATIHFTIALAASWCEAVDVVIDYRVHYQGARGVNAPKVFKLAQRRLEPNRPQHLARRHRFDHVSIRRIRPGPHTIDVQLNGRVAGSVTLEVDDPDC